MYQPSFSEVLAWLTPDEAAEVVRLVSSLLFVPNPGPQHVALESPAYELFYRGGECRRG